MIVRFMQTSNRVLFFLSLLGVAIAFYVLQGYLRNSPVVCLTNGCELVRKSPYSLLFGVPVSGYGLIGYGLLAILSFVRTFWSNRRISTIMLAIATGGAGFVVWFSAVQLFKIGGLCMWCLLSTVNMVTIFLLLVREQRYDYSN